MRGIRSWLGLGGLWLATASAGCGAGSSPATTAPADPTKFTIERITAARAAIPRAAVAESSTPAPTLLASLPGLKGFGFRETVIDALARIGTDSVEPLIATLADPDPALRADAARALALMGPLAEPAIPALTRALGDSDEAVRIGAARALGQIGPTAREAVPVLIEALRRAEASERAGSSS